MIVKEIECEGDRIAIVKTTKGNHYYVNVDRLVDEFVHLIEQTPEIAENSSLEEVDKFVDWTVDVVLELTEAAGVGVKIASID